MHTKADGLLETSQENKTSAPFVNTKTNTWFLVKKKSYTRNIFS